MLTNYHHKLISIITIISGVVLITCGSIGIGIYAYSVIDSLNKPDKSLIFWYLPFFFVGFASFVTGIFYYKTGHKSIMGNETAIKQSKYMLFGLMILIGFLMILVFYNTIIF
jgi:hypothetical protein